MVYTGLLLRLLAEYTANQKCSAVLLCSADSIYPRYVTIRQHTQRRNNYVNIGVNAAGVAGVATPNI